MLQITVSVIRLYPDLSRAVSLIDSDVGTGLNFAYILLF